MASGNYKEFNKLFWEKFVGKFVKSVYSIE